MEVQTEQETFLEQKQAENKNELNQFDFKEWITK